MNRNDSFAVIAGQLKAAQTILLFPHIHMDGDAMGSCAALCHVLRQMGKDCWVLREDSVPDNLRFLDRGYTTEDPDILGTPDICMCLDCGDESRFPKRVERFRSGRTKICVDHHRSSEYICDYNYIDPAAAATGELVYPLIRALGQEPDAECAEALFAAITTDTGNFQYSNTNRESHRIMCELYETGADFNRVSVQLYENNRLPGIRLHALAMENLALSADGRVASACITKEMQESCGADRQDSDGIVENLRSIAGVEIALLVKESEEDTVRVSMRVKNIGDVASICEQFGGGGHTKAAGCTYHGSVQDALQTFRALAEENLANYAE